MRALKKSLAVTKHFGADNYMDLISEFPLRRIKSAGDHAEAKKVALNLSIRKINRGSAEYLDVLIDLIADYEKRFALMVNGSKTSAAELVRHRIDERKLSVSSLARLIGVSQSNLSEMLSGKRDWSKAAIRGLSANLNIRAEHFLS